MGKLLGSKQMAEQLGLSRWSLQVLARTGRIPAIRLYGRRLLFDPESVEKAILATQQRSLPGAVAA